MGLVGQPVTEGVPVKIADIDSIGPINVIRRIAG